MGEMGGSLVRIWGMKTFGGHSSVFFELLVQAVQRWSRPTGKNKIQKPKIDCVLVSLCRKGALEYVSLSLLVCVCVGKVSGNSMNK